MVTIKSLGQQKEYELYLRKQYKEADKNNSGNLSFEECTQILDQLNIKMEKDELQTLFRKSNFIKEKDPEVEDVLNETEFVAFYYSLLKRPEVEEVFIKYATNTPSQSGPKMTVSDLMEFFTNEQKNQLSAEECSQLIEAFEPMKDRTSLSIEGTNLLLSILIIYLFPKGGCGVRIELA